MNKNKILFRTLVAYIFIINGVATCHAEDSYLARVYNKDSKSFQYITKSGEVAYDSGFSMAYDYSEGYAFVLLKDTTWALINAKGEIKYHLPDSIAEITTLYRVYSGRICYDCESFDIQLRDNILKFQCNYSYNNSEFVYFHIFKGILFKDRYFLRAQNFSEQKAYVTFYDSSIRKTGYINLDGELVIDLSSRFINQDAGEFYNGLAVLLTASEEPLDSCWLMDTRGHLTKLLWGSNFYSSKRKSLRIRKKYRNSVFVDDDCISKNYLPIKDAPNSYLRRCYYHETYNSMGQIGYCNNRGKLKLTLPKNYIAKGEFVKVK